MNLFWAWDRPNPFPGWFIPRHMLFLVEEFCCRFNRTNPIIMGPKKRIGKPSELSHRDALDKLFKLRREREGERFKGPRVIRSQGADSVVFCMTGERTFNITLKGATRKPRILPKSDVLTIFYNPTHALT